MADEELKRGTIMQGKDGTKYLFTGGDRYDKNAWKPLGTFEWAEQETKNRLGGSTEALRALVTGSVAAPAGGYAGLAGAALPGPPGQGARWSENVRNALTEQPQTPEGVNALNAVTAPFQWWSDKAQNAGGRMTDVLGPMAGTATRTALEMLPALVARGARGPVSNLKAKAQTQIAGLTADRLTKNKTWLAAQEEGYKVPPSAMGGGFVSNRIESIGGKAAVGQDFALHNQAITNKIARREAGLRPEQELTEGNLVKARDAMSEPYRQIAGLSTRAASALERLKQARYDAKNQWHFYNRSGSPDALSAAKKADAKALLLENVIEKEATRMKRPELADQLKAARRAIAKNYTVERALNVGTGEVDAQAIGRMLDSGQAMSGGLETVGRFALGFRPYTREASAIGTPGISKSEALASAGLGMAGAAGGMGWWPAGLPYLAPPARALLNSQMMQPGAQTLPQLGLGMRGMSAATAHPELLTLMPGIGMVGVPPEEYQPQMRPWR